jgi:hypothetical protein
VIISDASGVNPAREARRAAQVARSVAVAVALVGFGAAIYYAQRGLTLSHYDAKGHLVVARRIIDSLTPGWRQIGAVWLPLPHLLNFLPVQFDPFYRSGASGVAISIASATCAAYAIFSLVAHRGGSLVAAGSAAAILALNPNTLYLQSTPMTEPLLIALLLASTWLVRDWVDEGTRRNRIRAGIALMLACWTRYEAWPVTATLLGLALLARMRLGERPGRALADVLRLARYPIGAAVAFMVLSRATVGEWFVSTGFFVPENEALHHPLSAASQVVTGAITIAGAPLVFAGIAGAAAIALAALLSRYRASALVALAPLASAALPFYAFVNGHPYRVRYMVLHVASLALVSCGALTLIRRQVAAAGALALLAVTIYARPPLDSSAAMVREAQWDRPNSAARQMVTAYLRGHWDGQPVMASMGSLGHYMQELSLAGFNLRNFLHEGNGDLWKAALVRPAPYVNWILVEEKAEGGDMLAERARQDPAFLEGFTRAASGGGVVLYERRARARLRGSGAGSAPP